MSTLPSKGAIIGPHIINGVGPHLALLRKWQPRAALLLDPSADDLRALRAACPDTAIVVRLYVPDGEMSSRILSDPAGAAAFAHDLVLRHPAHASAELTVSAYWQVQNEVCQSWSALDALNAYECRRMAYADEAGYGCAILATSVGNLDMPEADRMALYRKVYPALRQAVGGRHVVCLHQYGAPDLWGPAEKGGADWLLHRLEHQLLGRLPAEFAGLKFVVTEYGIDGLILNDLPGYASARHQAPSASESFGTGIATPPKELSGDAPAPRSAFADALRGTTGPAGWRRFTTAADYAGQLIQAGAHCEQWAGRVLGYCVFTLGSNPPWDSYDIAGEVAERLANHYAAAQPPQEPPVIPPVEATVTKIYDINGVERDEAWMKAKYGTWISRAALAVDHYALVRVDEQVGPATLTVQTRDLAGKPQASVAVAKSWEGGQYDLTQPPCDVWLTRPHPRADVQFTSGADALTGFGLGLGEYIKDLKVGGPLATWVLHHQYTSDVLEGVGYLGGTEHQGMLKPVFQLVPAQAVEPPVVTPTATSLRDAAWNKLGVPYNPQAAFAKVAANNKLGKPETSEFDVVVSGVTYRMQLFALGYVYAVVGDWANTKWAAY